MKTLKRNIALLLSLCMVLAGINPAYADEVTVAEAAASDAITHEADEVLEVIEKASPAETAYDPATPSDAEYAAAEKPEKAPEKNSEESILKKATPSDAKKNTEVFIREITVDGIKITLTADPGVFPEDAELWAEKVEDTDTEEAIEEAVEKERDSSVNVASSYKFDIKMLVDGEEVQPDTTKGSVKVTFTLEEKLGDCLTANAYHLKEEADGALTAENLEAEVKTVEAVAMDSAPEDTLPVEKVLSDGIIESDAAVNTEVTEIEAEVTGFSYYVVEFTYDELQYVLPGDSSIKLSEILKTLAIEGTVSEAEVSNEDIFTVTKDTEGDDWTVTALQAFTSKEWMKVTIGSQVYEIVVTDQQDALEPVKYLYWDDTKKELVEGSCNSYTVVTSADNYSFSGDTWYVVKGTVNITNRIENNAAASNPAHLILTDGCEFNVPKGINNGGGKGLCIYGQANNSGTLSISGVEPFCAGIGGGVGEAGGNIIINGGTVTVTGGGYCAGIGGAQNGEGGKITINGGTITSSGGMKGAGIGGGYNGGGGSIIINGGTVNSSGGQDGAGIGGGCGGVGADVTISEGTVNAAGGAGEAGIGGGYESDNHGNLNLARIPGKITAGGTQKTVDELKSGYWTWPQVTIGYVLVPYTVEHMGQKEPLGSEYELLETETKTGYLNNDTEAVPKDYPGYEHVSTVQAKIEPDKTVAVIKYDMYYKTITFNLNGYGTAIDPIRKTPGKPISAPVAPTVDGYELKGWYTEKDCINPFTFHTMPENDMTLYAKWTLDPSQQRQDVQYVDADGSTKTASCIILSKTADFYTFGEGEWYAVTGNITIGSRIENKASEDSPAYLILTDGASLTVKGGIHNPGDKGLVIYGQSGGNGVLTITDVPESNAGIGGVGSESGGRITINGGTVTSTGGGGAAGIGGGRFGAGGKITINGGAVNATGGGGAAGIGGGGDGGNNSGGQITINGGTVNATGGHYGAGIGGGWRAHAGEITISGGNITAAGNGGAGIGGGNYGSGKTLTFEINPAVLKAGPNKDNFSDVDVDAYKSNNQNYGFVTMSYATASYMAEHWKQKTIRVDDYQYDTTETLTGFVNNYVEVVSKEYPGYGDPAYPPEKIKADGTTKIVAKYDMLYSTISFDANGHGTAPDPIYAIPGTTISAPKEPSEEHYIFSGWYTEAECLNQYTFSTMPSEDKTLYAKWTPIPYTITWKDGNTVLRTDKVDYDAMPDYGPDPSKTGYEFLLWWPTIQKVTGDATYNAIFYKPVVKHTVTWMLNDIKLIDTTEVVEGEMPVHENPERDGYIFIGWKPALAPITGNVKYTAYFEERGMDKVAVTFNTDGGTFINTQVIDRNTTPVKPSDPQKAGCRFEGWYRESGFITPYNFDEPFNTDMTLYAKWTVLPAVVYTVTWNMDDGTLIDITEEKEGNMPSHSNPSKEGYIFLGWEPSLAPVMGNITYTAKFEQRTPDKAAVTFNTVGGSFVETQVVTKGQKASKPEDPVKTGYEFVNWYADAAGATLYDFNTAVTADITIYAKWKKTAGREYTITWKDWNGTVLASSTVAENGLPKYPLASKPSRSGYIFTGWTPEIDLATADQTYTATYVKKSSGGGGGGGGGGAISTTKKTGGTFSPNWYSDDYGVWRIRNSAGQTVVNAWLCDDVITANGQNVWYLLTTDGAMIAKGLVQDNTGNFYSLETDHNGYFGMLRYKDGYYNCNGQQVYLTFNREHNGSFGAVTNADGIEKLKAIYGITKYGIGNENAVYTATF